VTALLAFDPSQARSRDEEFDPDHVDVTAAFADGGASQGVSHDDADTEPHPSVAVDEDDEDRDETSPTDSTIERLPWL
jgi:hypothetical protein